jgi:hypothetical protein
MPLVFETVYASGCGLPQEVLIVKAELSIQRPSVNISS